MILPLVLSLLTNTIPKREYYSSLDLGQSNTKANNWIAELSFCPCCPYHQSCTFLIIRVSSALLYQLSPFRILLTFPSELLVLKLILCVLLSILAVFLTGEMRRPRQFAIGVVSLYDSVGIFFLFNQMTIMAEKLSYLTSKIGGLLKEFKLVW